MGVKVFKSVGIGYRVMEIPLEEKVIVFILIFFFWFKVEVFDQ